MIQVGTEVGWAWLNSVTTGVVEEIHLTRHEIISKNKHIVRNVTKDDPALVIKHAKGSMVLKLQHEVQELTKDS